MKEFLPYVPTGGLLLVCFALVKMMNGKLNSKVDRQECHSAQQGIKDRIGELDKNLNRRFDDLKDFITENRKK